MKKSIRYLLLVLPLFWGEANAQEKDVAAVREVVERVFKAMEVGDSAMLRSAFTDNVSMATIFTDRSGKPALRVQASLDRFAEAVATPRDDTWYEEIWNVEVKIDGNLAQLWCDYAFYTNKTFHHCGVDAFHLFKADDGWKIFHLADTRRTEGCNVPDEIRKRRE